ncbi:hypothetical protein DRO42_02280 [Candidatus Bathyarchaeota archaeon]|nr:MAG: hypothetical protein DRO42_02280 [Candidatus Bathyarchaeota archaeon]
MAWTRLGFALYLCAIVNFLYAFYSLTQLNIINTVISTTTYLLLIYAVAIIEEESEQPPAKAD